MAVWSSVLGRVDRWTWHGRACCCFRGQIRRKSSCIGKKLDYSPISSFEQKAPSRRSVRGSKCKEKVGPTRLSRDGSGHVSDMGHARDAGLWGEGTRDGKTVWLGSLASLGGWTETGNGETQHGPSGNGPAAGGVRRQPSTINHHCKLSRWGTVPGRTEAHADAIGVSFSASTTIINPMLSTNAMMR